MKLAHLLNRLWSVLKLRKITQNGLPEPNIFKSIEPIPAPLAAEKLLAGKTALITGAGHNIGRAIALEMAQQGANIVLTDLNELSCIALKQQILACGVDCRYFVADITNFESNQNICQCLLSERWIVDILVNNVGINSEGLGLKGSSSKLLGEVFATNVFGPMDLTQQIAQTMMEQRRAGVILFITSMHQSEISRWLGYSASKAALQMLVKELALDLAGYSIRVNGIAPGWVQETVEGKCLPHPYTPLHKTSINPGYIGRAAVFLASDYFSRFTTGSVLTVDAGLSLYNYRAFQHPPEQV
jgi:NAD(P)-dependent dehydrogenase (short-subunit alcohol dehydrogenase family)